MTSSESKEPQGSERSSSDSLNELCWCGHQHRRHLEALGAQCAACFGDEKRSWRHEFTPEEPPLTPEEEEEASSDEECPHIGSYVVVANDGPRPNTQHACPTCHAEWTVYEDCPPPPQPERRPPYAVSYSVQGHLFEVALSGDATVRAVDGALVIQHHLGPVAGIVSVLPVINKES